MILPADLKRWRTEFPDAWFHYTERAGIREHCGNEPREVAEREAEAEARREWARPPPRRPRGS
jgi:hypothetical protein